MLLNLLDRVLSQERRSLKPHALRMRHHEDYGRHQTHHSRCNMHVCVHSCCVGRSRDRKEDQQRIEHLVSTSPAVFIPMPCVIKSESQNFVISPPWRHASKMTGAVNTVQRDQVDPCTSALAYRRTYARGAS